MRVVFMTKQGWMLLIATCVFIAGNCVLLYRFIDRTSVSVFKNINQLREDKRFKTFADKVLPRAHLDSRLFDVAAAVNELQKNRSKSRTAKLTSDESFSIQAPRPNKEEHGIFPDVGIKQKGKEMVDSVIKSETPESKPTVNFADSQRQVVSKVSDSTETKGMNNFVTAVLVIACNRPTVKRCLDLLLEYRPSAEHFPIVVSQDCGHQETANVIASYGTQVTFIQQPDLAEVQGVPSNMKKFMGYYKISRHYKWALGQTFDTLGHNTVIIVEDDLDVAPDFFEYFTATNTLLDKDQTLWCISAWNDNGKEGMVERNDILYRTDFFPGLGWMIKKPLWDELRPKWPLGFWDDWMREPAQRKDRACIRPEISRTRTFGRIGVSHGQFFDQHLKFIKLNDQMHPFTKTDLSYLLKENYHKKFVNRVHSLPMTTTDQLIGGKVFAPEVQIHYSSQQEFDRIAKLLGAMSDFKAGVPRTGYQGIVTFIYKGVRVHIAPSD